MTPQPTLITSFARLSAAQTIALSRTVQTKLANHSAFPEPWPPYVTSLQKLGENTNLLEASQHAALTRDTLRVAERNGHNETVKGDLGTIAKHVNLASKGDLNLLMSTGFPMRRQRTRSGGTEWQQAPQLTMKHGQSSGIMIGKVSKPRGVGGHEVQITDGDPTIEANWKHQGSYSNCGFSVVGLQPGNKYSFRSRYIGPTGTGPWSNPFTLISL